jgi:site-specific DNA-cytosine methylase
MNVLSLFDGMSGAQIAFNRAGIHYDNYFASEVDKFAIKVAQANYPKTIQLGTVENWKQWNLPAIDLLIAGSPCQGFSLAGKHLNFEDPRSKLFFTFVEVLKHYKPKYFLLENVKMKKEYEEIITEIMGVQPARINSALVSAQDRKRLYWANFPISQPEDKGILLQDIVESGIVDRDKSYPIDANYHKGGSSKYLQRTYQGKAKRQAVKYQSARRLMVEEDEYRMLTPLECERLQTVPEGYTNHVSKTQRYRMLGNGFTIDVIAHILKCMQEKTWTQDLN